MRILIFSNVVLSLALVGCGAIKHHSQDAADDAPHASEAFLEFGVFATGDVVLSSSSSDQRIYAQGRVSLAQSTIGPIAHWQGGGCSVSSETSLTLRDVSIKTGSACASGSLSLTGVDPNLPVQHQLDTNSVDLRTASVAWLKKLAVQSATVTAVTTKRNQTLSVDQAKDVPLAVANVAPEDFFETYKLDRAGAMSRLIVVVPGMAVTMKKLTMLEAFSPTDTIWYFPDATTVKISSSTLRGTLVAPHATVSISSTRFEGGIFASSVTGDVKMLWQPLKIELAP